MTGAPIDMDALIELTESAGYGPHDPVVAGAGEVFLAQGRTATGAPFTADTLVYLASVSKQITAACAALLVRRGRLDPESALARWMPELPGWARTVRVRHLIHHTSGLPEGVHLDDLLRAEPERTTAGVLGALRRIDRLAAEPGTEFRYSNAGYVCLAVVVERAAGRPLPEFAHEHVFTPLAMPSSRYWTGPAPHPPGAAPLDPLVPAPLSPGDGGVWSTARDLMRWNAALDRDELGVTALLQTPGHLDDGTPLDYGWGLAVRTHAGHRVYSHAGSWPGSSTQLLRFADRSAGFVIIALDDDMDRLGALTLALARALGDLIGRPGEGRR
ncbi:serine hydrolase [Actinoplanes sp. L3-i22]|uniref:serine hydrolase domain-containing protein n=1 Tax=Actinoplanes sp. L3-i22 TaxID=2836373 RepID=UPI001C7654A0|nr:serine hydrolase domain-containing protein [Actinoplanes sp. L3-i22]BCY09986.1 serine hydrolase [Actinoplanes sp. L3-i22]